MNLIESYWNTDYAKGLQFQWVGLEPFVETHSHSSHACHRLRDGQPHHPAHDQTQLHTSIETRNGPYETNFSSDNMQQHATNRTMLEYQVSTVAKDNKNTGYSATKHFMPKFGMLYPLWIDSKCFSFEAGTLSPGCLFSEISGGIDICI